MNDDRAGYRSNTFPQSNTNVHRRIVFFRKVEFHTMATWKLVLLKAAGYAGGVILALSVVVGSIVWYTSRPVKPKPWNRDSIVASYYRVTESDESNAKLEFEYILDNKTDRDY